MRQRVPESLTAQATAAHAAAEAAWHYFDAPTPGAADLALRARLQAKAARQKADAELEAWKGPKGDWLEVSAALAVLADEAAWAVEEHRRFGAELGAAGRHLAAGLERASALLAQALKAGAADEEPLAQAKNRALQIEDIRRMGRAAAFNMPLLAAELSARAVLDRFSKAGEAVHRAADALAARMGEAS